MKFKNIYLYKDNTIFEFVVHKSDCFHKNKSNSSILSKKFNTATPCGKNDHLERQRFQCEHGLTMM